MSWLLTVVPLLALISLVEPCVRTKGGCKLSEFYTGYGCLKKTVGKPEFCPVDQANPPPTGFRRCVNGGNDFWYIHVGGQRKDWNEGTDAMCLSTESKPAAWGRQHCQYAGSKEECMTIFRNAGCYEGPCPDTEYYTGYECRSKKIGKSEFCPVDTTSPPSDGLRRCVHGGNNFWYIHVGGQKVDWIEGTDAMCLSTDSKPAAWGRQHCQFAWSEAGCKEVFKNAGCFEGRCPNNEYYTGYECRRKTVGKSEFCPAVGNSVRRCVNGGNNFWYIHLGGQKVDWNEGTDAKCLSIGSKPTAWGRQHCQFAWSEPGCKEIFKNAGCFTGRCPSREYYTGYGCRVKTVGQSRNCPLYTASSPPGDRARCVHGGNNFWYIHVGGQKTDWNRGTDAQCLSTDSQPTAWGRKPCQSDWNEAGCLEILKNAGC